MTWLALLAQIENELLQEPESRQNRQKETSAGSAGTGGYFNSVVLATSTSSDDPLLHWLVCRGLEPQRALSLSHSIKARSNHADARSTCVECKHLWNQDGVWRCRNGHQPSATFGTGVPSDMIDTPHRCSVMQVAPGLPTLALQPVEQTKRPKPI